MSLSLKVWRAQKRSLLPPFSCVWVSERNLSACNNVKNHRHSYELWVTHPSVHSEWCTRGEIFCFWSLLIYTCRWRKYSEEDDHHRGDPDLQINDKGLPQRRNLQDLYYTLCCKLFVTQRSHNTQSCFWPTWGQFSRGCQSHGSLGNI